MDDPYAVDRRAFLRTGTAAAAAAATACGGARGRWRALTDDEARTLAAACDGIVPPDQDAGAAEAGAVEFVDRQLATRQRRDVPFWQAGLRGLDATARRRAGQPFADLPADQQTAVLADVERGKVERYDWGDLEPRTFFARLRDYTMMGFYGDPRHGGNKDRVSWKMLGLPDPPIRGRRHDAAPPPVRAAQPPRKG